MFKSYKEVKPEEKHILIPLGVFNTLLLSKCLKKPIDIFGYIRQGIKQIKLMQKNRNIGSDTY